MVHARDEHAVADMELVLTVAEDEHDASLEGGVEIDSVSVVVRRVHPRRPLDDEPAGQPGTDTELQVLAVAARTC